MKKFKLLGLVLIVVGALFLTVLQPKKPEAVCVSDGRPSSGFIDDVKNCNISIESYQKISDFEAQSKTIKLLGIALAVAGLALVALGLKNSHPNTKEN